MVVLVGGALGLRGVWVGGRSFFVFRRPLIILPHREHRTDPNAPPKIKIIQTFINNKVHIYKCETYRKKHIIEKLKKEILRRQRFENWNFFAPPTLPKGRVLK